jgi:hypothetical protein
MPAGSRRTLRRLVEMRRRNRKRQGLLPLFEPEPQSRRPTPPLRRKDAARRGGFEAGKEPFLLSPCHCSFPAAPSSWRGTPPDGEETGVLDDSKTARMIGT